MNHALVPRSQLYAHSKINEPALNERINEEE